MIPHDRARPFWASSRSSISAGHWMPASASTRPLSESNRITRFIRDMSIRMVPDPNCCPPMACRPPAMLMASPSDRARRMISWIASIDVGVEGISEAE